MLSLYAVGGGAGGTGAVGATAAEMGASTIGSRAAGAGGAYKRSSKVGTALNVTKGVAGVAAKYASVLVQHSRQLIWVVVFKSIE